MDPQKVDEMNEGNKHQIKTELLDLFILEQERMVAFDFTQYRITLDRAGLLQNNTHGAFVCNLKNNPVTMVCCDFCG